VLPALIASRRPLARRRLMMGAASALLALAAVGASVSANPAPAREVSLAMSLHPSMRALAVPSTWFAAPLPRVRVGDVLDIEAVRTGEKAYSIQVAVAARVLSSDERGVVIEVDENDAGLLVNARATGMLIVPLLRPDR
jgi:hypothetical protein